jgi:UDP-N-acetylmuramoyl-tripeptide--D-alanyl-D-alanine ligase
MTQPPGAAPAPPSAHFDGAALAAATGGSLHADGPAGPIFTDSRRPVPGGWFVALEGDRFDGHSFLPALAAAAGDGAPIAGALVRRAPEGWPFGLVVVDDTLAALQAAGAAARGRFSGPVVGITGSAGKTTTRALVALALSARGQVHHTEGNLNNHIGVPLTLLAAPPGAWAWVVEMGMNHLGEIDLLQRLAAPTVRVITNVGPAHLEGCGGTLEGVAQAKGELFAGARPGDVCCVNLDDPRVAALPLPAGVRRLGWGRSAAAEVRLVDAEVCPDTLGTRFRVETPGGGVEGSLAVPGVHLAMNACAAVAAAVALGVELGPIGAALSSYAPVGMRARVQAGPGGLLVLNDAYNANPLSTDASLRALAAVGGRRRVALLGDMLELGPAELDLHTQTLELALSLGLDLVGVAGPRFAAAAARLGGPPGLLIAEDAAALGHAAAPALRPGDLVLLKGSRGLAMERALSTLSAPDAGDR